MLDVITVGAVVVAAVSQRQVQAVGSGGTGGERHDRFEPQLVDRAGAIRADKFCKLAADGGHVGARLGGIHVVFSPDQADGVLFGDLFQGEVRHQGSSGVKVQDAVGIDDQSAVTVGVETEVDAAFFIVIDAAIVIQPGLRIPHGNLLCG